MARVMWPICCVKCSQVLSNVVLCVRTVGGQGLACGVDTYARAHAGGGELAAEDDQDT